jgi:ABC-type antimicrobial peptide transport system ATPase subunit
MLGLFAVVVVAAYRKELLGLLTRRNRSTEQSIALTIVNDLVAVTELRDKLAAENCPQGVEACTALLRVIVEHTQKNVG